MSTLALSPKTISRTSPWMPTRLSLEIVWDYLDGFERQAVEKVLGLGSIRDKILRMSGSDCVRTSQVLGELAFGKTAFAGDVTWYAALYTAAIDDTLLGNTANEAAYTSYARLALTNNTTIFAAGSGTTTRVQTWPSDALKSFPASTGGTSTDTFLGVLNGNAGTSSDKGGVWASISSVTVNSGDTPQIAQNAFSQTRD